MNALNLHADDPVLLVDRATAAELFAALRALAAWDEQALKTADLLISVWSAQAIARPNDREGIAELQRLIRYAREDARSAATLPPEFANRWQCASDLLEARRLDLAHADPEAQLHRRHVPEILRALAARKEVPQSELAGQLRVSSGRVTQVIGPLEANGLLTKRRHGRDNLLQITEKGREFVKAAPPVSAPPKKRAASFLTLPQAA